MTRTPAVRLACVGAAFFALSACRGTSGNVFTSIANGSAAAGVVLLTTALPSTVVGSPYSASLSAVGGRSPYAYTIASGSLPPGITLGASGSFAGNATTSGTSTFAVRATDTSTPPLVSPPQLLTIRVAVAATAQTSWYVRPDGGTRYSPNVTTGQCDGMADAAYPGSGSNQHCAFNDARFLYMDGSYGNKAWVIAGGDTVLLRGGPYRIGYTGPDGTLGNFGGCPGDAYGCTNPVVPAGTADHPTQILGESWQTCVTKTQLFGGYALGTVLDLAGAQFVELACLELTDHAECSRIGSPALPSACSSDPPLDDFAQNGITTDTSTSNVVLRDLDVHGFTSHGIWGPLGGELIVTRVRIGYNAEAGWDLDDGNGTQNVNGSIVASDLTIEWSGCNEEYPITHPTPAVSCYDDNSGGYGDGFGTPDTPLELSCDRCTIRNNTQDGIDLSHASATRFSVTDSALYANMGQQLTYGPATSAFLQNDLVVASCRRMSAAIATAPSAYNAQLSDFCRASGDAFTFVLGAGETLTLQNDSITGYAATLFDIGCNGDCTSGSVVFENNIARGYTLPAYNSGQASALFYLQPGATNALFTARDHNLFFGTRDDGCPSTGFADERCLDPAFVNEPSSLSAESSLDDFDFDLSADSTAHGTGVFLPSLPTDYADDLRGDPPSIGAVEGKSGGQL